MASHQLQVPAMVQFWKDSRIADIYKVAGAVTGSPGRHLIKQAKLLEPSNDGLLVVLDNACGTGIITALLYEMLGDSEREKLHVICGDSSERMIKAVQESIDTCEWKGAKAQLIDAQETGLPDDFFTHVLTSFAVMVFANPAEAMNECFRVLRPGGVCGFTTWSSLGWIEDVRDAIATIPGAPAIPDTATFLTVLFNRWHHPEYIEEQLKTHGFKDIEVVVSPNLTPVESPAAYAAQYGDVFIRFISSKFWTADDREKYGPSLIPALEKHLTEKYGEEKSFELEMNAIVATGRKP